MASYKKLPEVEELRAELAKAEEKHNLEGCKTKINELKNILEQKQKDIESVLKAIARCECRLKDLIEIRLSERVRNIKSSNSYRALMLES